MAKQVLKHSAMLALLISLAFVAAAVPAQAQTSGRVAADVPFNFVVGDKNLQAGKYIISEMTNAGEALRIHRRDLRSSVVRMSQSIERPRGNTTAKLVFHRYGDQYFLAEVWGADKYGRKLAKSSRERSLERELSSTIAKSDFSRNSYERIEVLATVR